MKTCGLFLITLILFAADINIAQSFYSDNPLVATYSIVARDPETGEMGVAVQSHWFSVGSIVSWGEAGVQVEIPPKAGVTVIDARPAARNYDLGHIPGAINIPDSQFEKMTDKLPADKASLLIFYCEGPECMLSHKSAFRAEKLGYTNIKVYANGFPEWKARGMNVAVSAAFIKKHIDERPTSS